MSRVDFMGILGLSWQEHVVGFLQKQMGFSSWAERDRVNPTTIDNLETEYLALQAQGAPPVNFVTPPDSDGNGGDFDSKTLSISDTLVSKTGVDETVVMHFLRAIYVLARDGTIPRAKLDPRGYQASDTLRASLPTEQNTFLKTVGTVATGATGMSKVLMMIAGVGAVAYLLSQLKTFTHK